MSTTDIATDYLVIGAGAVGMAFVDTLLDETEADIVLVDRFAAPGGHWNDAYPFVTLHQPSAFYGVASTELSRGTRDRTGLNRGLADLATGAEVRAYFSRVMRERFLPSGRVRFYPSCEWQGGGRFTSRLSGETFEAEHAKLVDATLLKTTIPKTHTPNFEVAEGVRFMPLNDLPDVGSAPDGFVVIGGGKTGMDAVIFLLEQGVPPSSIRWVLSRDGYMLNRRNAQNEDDFFEDVLGAQIAQYEALADAADMDDLFQRLEAGGYFLRLDPEHTPTMFHGPTVSEGELEALRTVDGVIRMGRVTAIHPDRIVLERGEVPTTPGTVHVDCSASAIKNYTPRPVFEGDTIRPQTVRPYQPVFSGSLCAYVEAHYDDEAHKNALCTVVRLPDTLEDYLHFTRAAMMNQYRWGQDKDLRQWIAQNRLDGFSQLFATGGTTDERRAMLKRLRGALMRASIGINRLMAKAGIAD